MSVHARAIRRRRDRFRSALPRLVLILGSLATGAAYLATRPLALPDRYWEVELAVTGMH
jgi:hypothetical protein